MEVEHLPVDCRATLSDLQVVPSLQVLAVQSSSLSCSIATKLNEGTLCVPIYVKESKRGDGGQTLNRVHSLEQVLTVWQ